MSLLLGFASAAAVASPATATTGDDEQRFVQLINQLRASRGLNSLAVDGELRSQARAWASQMAASDQLYHAPNIATGISSPWTVLGENVGVHGIHDPDALFQAFVASPAHYQNLVDPRFNYVGVGVVHSDNGKLWTTHRFMAVDVAPPATSPPTTAPPTTQTPTTQTPTTQTPTTQTPTTQTPTTQTPTTQTPTTQTPTTQTPTTQTPTTGSAVTASPTSAAPTSETPTTAAPTAPPLQRQEIAEMIQPDVSTIEEVLIDLVEAGI